MIEAEHAKRLKLTSGIAVVVRALHLLRSMTLDRLEVSKAAEGDSPLPPLGDWAGDTPPRPSTTTGAFGRPSSSSPGSQNLEEDDKNHLLTPPR